jgi:hypothetical protein
MTNRFPPPFVKLGFEDISRLREREKVCVVCVIISLCSLGGGGGEAILRSRLA